MSISSLARLGDVLIKPVDLLCEWGKEPLKRAEHRRSEESKDKDIQRDIERESGVQRALSDQKLKETQFLTDLEIKQRTEIARVNMEIDQVGKDKEFERSQREKQHEADIQKSISEQKIIRAEHLTNLKIKRETEVIRIIAEIEQLKKDKEFERMKAVSDAMMRYQNELTRINVEAVEAIGSMRIELQKKAYDLIHEKTRQYAELQDLAFKQAADQLNTIDSNLAMSDSAKEILRMSVAKKLAGVVDNATRFIEQLNYDMQSINKDISFITSSGQGFIERHLSQFQVIGFSAEATQMIDNSQANISPVIANNR